MSAVTLDGLIATMTAARVVRVRTPDGWEVELHPTAFTPREAPDSEPAVPTDCRCGHRVAEHNDLGCIAQAMPGVPPCGCDRPWGEDDAATQAPMP